MTKFRRGIVRLGGMLRERRKQRALEAEWVTDNYTLFGSIMGGYCGLLSSSRKNSR